MLSTTENNIEIWSLVKKQSKEKVKDQGLVFHM